jgi:hypothetical protein
MKALVKYVLLFICFAIGVAFAIGAMHAFVYPSYFNSAGDAVFLGMFAALFLLAAFLLFRWQPSTNEGKYRPGGSSQNRLFEPVFFDKNEEVNRREFQSAMTDGWHYIEGTKQVGPVDLEEIKAVLSKISDPRHRPFRPTARNRCKTTARLEMDLPANHIFLPNRFYDYILQWVLAVGTKANRCAGRLRSGFGVDRCLAQQGRKEARYVRNHFARYCSWGGCFGLHVYCRNGR